MWYVCDVLYAVLYVCVYSTIIHALIGCRLDYCNYILYNVPRSKQINYKDFGINVRVENILPRFEKKYIGSKFKIESYAKC